MSVAELRQGLARNSGESGGVKEDECDGTELLKHMIIYERDE